MLVKATEASSKLGIKIKELGRIASNGETFEVTPLRFKVLSGENRFKSVFVIEATNKSNFTKEIDAIKLYEDNLINDNSLDDVDEKESIVVNEPIENFEEASNENESVEVKPKKRGRKKKK